MRVFPPAWTRVIRPLTRHNAKAKPVLIATARTVLQRSGKTTVHVTLSSAGRRLLKGSKHMSLTTNATFTPTGANAVTVTKTCTVKP
jgi:2-methylaconitate cis-trans-isomerase PrpF